jgi:hypothetical protein
MGGCVLGDGLKTWIDQLLILWAINFSVAMAFFISIIDVSMIRMTSF